jgi:NAD(P)-dependent dehydrogenase (short-subunit alcohol dehydrogenase family)
MGQAEDQEHRGRVAVITGGARGFGKAFGEALARRGAHVVLADIDGEAAASAAAEMTGLGLGATAEVCDVADDAQVEAMVGRVVGRLGGIDILINNAGLHSAAYSGMFGELGLAKVRRLFEVNIMGVVACSLAARDAMSSRPGAAIVNISSVASYKAPNPYGVSKLAVRGLTMAMAREFAPLGIRVNAIAPGLIFTDTIRAELPQAMVEDLLKQQLLPREGQERDIVEAMLHLVSSRASFVTGETLRVSGGYTLTV